MKETVGDWRRFQQTWDGVLNFLMEGECVPFSYEMPPIERIVEELRRDPDSRITSGAKAETLELTDISESFRRLPIEEALHSPFALAHFKLERFLRLHCKGVRRPPGITPDDELSYDMTPGTVLWNTFLTPHWVEASDSVACSINISHGGLRYKGKLCRHEEEVVQWQNAHPDAERVLH